ncbi:UNVERIFIED_CONTAM: non-specific protein-tyrosine kinase [Williamsia faeni]
MSIAEFSRIIVARWLIVASTVLLSVLVALMICATMPKTYSATSTSLLTASEQNPDLAGDIRQSGQYTVERIQSYLSLVKSPRVLEPVIDELKLDEGLRELASAVTATTQPDTALLHVTALDEDPKRAAEISNAISRSLGTTISELETSPESRSPTVRVALTTPALPSDDPVSPRTEVFVLVALAFGIGLGFAAAIVRDQFDDRIKSADKLAELTGARPLGVVTAKNPRVTRSWRRAAQSSSDEVYPWIWSNLQFSHSQGERPLSSLALAPVSSTDGNARLAYNLAAACSMRGSTVCLVDADLRSGELSTLAGIGPDKGLDQVLDGVVSVDDALVSLGGRMSALPAGRSVPDASGKLGSASMKRLIETLAARFDVVIYAVPALASAPDAIVVGRQTSGLLLHVRKGITTSRQIKLVTESFRVAQVNCLGSVLTDCSASDIRSSSQVIPPNGTDSPASADLAGVHQVNAHSTSGHPAHGLN